MNENLQLLLTILGIVGAGSALVWGWVAWPHVKNFFITLYAEQAEDADGYFAALHAEGADSYHAWRRDASKLSV